MTSKRSARGGQSLAVRSEQKSKAAPGVSRKYCATSISRDGATISDQLPTQYDRCVTAPGRPDCSAAMNAGTSVPAGGGGSGGPWGGASVRVCSACFAGPGGSAADGAGEPARETSPLSGSARPSPAGLAPAASGG